MSETELAWAAGLFDGEGSIFASKTSARPGYVRLNMTVAMTEEDPVRRFHKAIGLGTVVEIRRKTTTGKQVYRWQSWSKVAREAIDVIWPYLSQPKKDQAQRAIDAREHYETVIKPVTLSQAASLRKKEWWRKKKEECVPV